MTHIAKETFTVRELCARYCICRATFYAEVKRGRRPSLVPPGAKRAYGRL
jgi:hypothetical protein